MSSISPRSPASLSKEPKPGLNSRNRENQRQSRARRKEYIASLETKVREYERQGAQATLDMQKAAREVMEENVRLKEQLVALEAARTKECAKCSAGTTTNNCGRQVKRKTSAHGSIAERGLQHLTSALTAVDGVEVTSMMMSSSKLPDEVSAFLRASLTATRTHPQQCQPSSIQQQFEPSYRPSPPQTPNDQALNFLQPESNQTNQQLKGERRSPFSEHSADPDHVTQSNTQPTSAPLPPATTSSTVNLPSSCCGGATICSVPVSSLTPSQLHEIQKETTPEYNFMSTNDQAPPLTATREMDFERPSNNVTEDMATPENTTDCHDAVSLFNISSVDDQYELRTRLCKSGLAGFENHCRVDNRVLFKILDEMSG